MALRFAFPNFEVVPEYHLKEPHRPPPRAAPPVVVEFRTGADLTDVVDGVKNNRYVRIDAAVGTGKSVRVPAALATGLNKPVVHTVPHPRLIEDLQEYVSGMVNVPTKLVTEVSEDLVHHGVTFMSTATYVAWVVSREAAKVPEHVLFMDESHESDGPTGALRESALSKPYVARLVLASATAAPDGFRRRETAGTVSVSPYPAGRFPKTWRVDEPGMPWHYANIVAHTFMFVERDADAARLMSEYSDYGFISFRLTSRSSRQDYRNARAALRDPRTGIVLLFVDSSYQSGFTIPEMRDLIHGGEMGYMSVHDNQAVRKFRETYAGEQEQAVGRIGRVQGSVGRAYVPAGDRPSKICDLEGVESDATALLLRYLGHKPAPEYRSSPMSSGDVPRALAQTLNGPLPLRMLAPNMLASWPGVQDRNANPAVDLRAADDNGLADVQGRELPNVIPPTPVISSPVVTYSPGMPDVGFYAGDARDALSDTESLVSERTSLQDKRNGLIVNDPAFAEEVSVDPTMDIGSVFDKLLAETAVLPKGLEVGKYYYYPGANPDVVWKRVFPRGLSSLLDYAMRDDFTHIVKGFDADTHLAAVSLVLNAYNQATVELRGLRRLIEAAPKYREQLALAPNREAVHSWLTRLAESVSLRVAQVNSYGEVLMNLTPRGYVEMQTMTEAEDRVIDHHLAGLIDVVKDVKPCDVDAYQRSVSSTAQPLYLEGGFKPVVQERRLLPAAYSGHRRALSDTDDHTKRMLAPTHTVSRGRDVTYERFRDERSPSRMRTLAVGFSADGGHKQRWFGFFSKLI